MKTEKFVSIGCGSLILLIVAFGALGGLCVDYCLQSWFHKNIPFIFDCLISFLTGELVIPAAVVTLIVNTWAK